eukprot:1195076-Prorocentrum_minimum.AAC.3
MLSAVRQLARRALPVVSQQNGVPRTTSQIAKPVWVDLCPRGFSSQGVRELATTSQNPVNYLPKVAHGASVTRIFSPLSSTMHTTFAALCLPPRRIVGSRAQFDRIILRGFASDAGSGATAAAEPKMGKFKTLWKQYGWTFLGTYLSVYVATLSGIYLLVYNGFMKPDSFSDDDMSHPHGNPHVWQERVDGWFKKYLGLDLGLDKFNPKTSTFVTAWFATKLTEPVRFVFAAMITPRVARLFGRVPKAL